MTQQYPTVIPTAHASFADPENVKLMLRLGLVAPDADEWDLYQTWGRIIRAGHCYESLKQISPARLARLKEEISDNVVEFPSKHGTPKVEQ